MSEKRKKYDREFREGAVRIVRETGKPVAQAARDLWRRRAEEPTVRVALCRMRSASDSSLRRH
jgi:hypothetical protein